MMKQLFTAVCDDVRTTPIGTLELVAEVDISYDMYVISVSHCIAAKSWIKNSSHMSIVTYLLYATGARGLYNVNIFRCVYLAFAAHVRICVESMFALQWQLLVLFGHNCSLDRARC